MRLSFVVFIASFLALAACMAPVHKAGRSSHSHTHRKSAHAAAPSLHFPHASHHIRDLEKDLEKVKETEQGMKKSDMERLKGEIDEALTDMNTLQTAFSRVKADLEHVNVVNEPSVVHEEASPAEVVKADAQLEEKPKASADVDAVVNIQESATEKADDKVEFSGSDAEDWADEPKATKADDESADNAFIQLDATVGAPFDDMNPSSSLSADEDDSPIPVAAMMNKRRARLTAQLAQVGQEQPGQVSGDISADQARRGLENGPYNDGETYRFGAFTDGDKFGTYDITEDGSEILHHNRPVKEYSPGPTRNETNPDHDVVCVCKRNGAPRGKDRIRCKRHPEPSPSPTPKPTAGIRQCVNGTWPLEGTVDDGTRDTICISFPGQVAQPPPDVEEEEPEYPPECYDDRNEFVVDSMEKRPYDQFLLQQGFEKCAC